jgi:hypothetical protein
MVSTSKITEGNGGPRTICIMNAGSCGGKKCLSFHSFILFFYEIVA